MKPNQPKKTFWKRLQTFTFKLGLLVVLAGLVWGIPQMILTHHLSGLPMQTLEAGFGILFIVGFLTWFVSYLRFEGETWDAAQRALTPIPRIPELRQQLTKEMGREPTLVEMAAVQQMMVHERNQDAARAAFGAAVTVSAYEIAKSHRR
jgi:hypothetical protein